MLWNGLDRWFLLMIRSFFFWVFGGSRGVETSLLIMRRIGHEANSSF